MQTSPERFARSATACASASESASGISTCTCLPAFRHCRVCAACNLRRRAQDGRSDARARQRFGEIRGGVRHAILARDFFGGRELSPHDRHHFDAVDEFARIEMLLAEGAHAGDDYLDRLGHLAGSRMRCPTAVFEAGT